VTVLARAYARKAVRHRFKRRRDEWAETIGEWRNRSASLPRYTPAGMRIAVCPATYSDATCKTCDACARVRDAVVGFPAPMAPGDASNPQPPLAMSPSGSPGDSVGEIQQKPARWMVMVCG
jgi:hypothetical protein